jgi:hypothetical protein
MRLDLGGILDAGDRVLELTHTYTERPSDLRKPLRAEEQKRDEQKNDQVRW